LSRVSTTALRSLDALHFLFIVGQIITVVIFRARIANSFTYSFSDETIVTLNLVNEVTGAVIVCGAFVTNIKKSICGVFTSSASFGVRDIKTFEADISIVTVEI
jgi:hypothetical protein